MNNAGSSVINKNPIKHPLIKMLSIFMLCFSVHLIEVLFIKTEETFFADNFINKLFGILVLAVSLKLFKYTWQMIGFRKDKLFYLIVGLGVGIFCFTIAYATEYFILYKQGAMPNFEWYISGFSLTDETVKQTGLLAFSLCILLNIVNVIMEEGIFRGLFIRLGMENFSFSKANLFAATLFGLWHISMPIKSYVDGEMDVKTAVLMGIGYVILAMIMGIKWGLWLSSTKSLWFGIAEHFFNNTITNMLHVSTAYGSDDLQIVRIIIAQMLSLAITLLARKWIVLKVSTKN